MKRKKLNIVIASIGVVSLGFSAPINSYAKINDFNNGLDYSNESPSIKKTNEEIKILTKIERFDLIKEEALKVKAEREEQERLRLIKEEEERQRAIEEARIAEINRINNVCVNLDDVLQVSNINTEELLEIFDYYTYANNMKELAWIFIEAEKTYGINAFILAAIASWESAYNTSYRAIYDNNVLGWGVYSPSAEGINASSKYENIMNAAKFLREEYLTPDGLYFNGYTTWGINQRYCLNEYGQPDDEWRIGVNAIAKNYEWAYKNIVVK